MATRWFLIGWVTASLFIGGVVGFILPTPSDFVEDSEIFVELNIEPYPQSLELTQELEEQADCLVLNAYHEARGESERGILGVMHVTRNRVLHADFPDSYCEVVFEGVDQAPSCQFSWACDDRPDRMTDRASIDRIREIAIEFVTTPHRIFPPDPTRGSTHYHRYDYSVWWSDHPRMVQTVSIGDHIYYDHGINL